MTHKERYERRQAIAEMIRNGSTWQEAADKFDVTLACVGHACQEAGMVGRRGGKFNSYAIIADLLNTSATLTEIAQKHGKLVSDVSSVYQRCIGYGIPVRERKQGWPKRKEAAT